MIPPARTTQRTSIFKRNNATKAAMLRMAANQLTSPVKPFGKITAAPKTSARFKITPTTAAVTPESAPFSVLLPRSFSIYGTPRKINRNDGRNVV